MISHIVGIQIFLRINSTPLLLAKFLFHKTVLGRPACDLILTTCTGYMEHSWEDEVFSGLGVKGKGSRWILD